MKVTCLGDSLTSGQHLLYEERPWPRVFAELTGYEVKNAGVPNDTTRTALERFPRDVQEDPPDILIIQFGLNDCNRWETDRGLPRVSDMAFRANLSEMIQRAERFGIESITVCGPTPTTKSPRHREDADHYGNLARGVASTHRVGYYRPMLTEQHLLDHVHLTAEGHRVFAEGLVACLQQPVAA